MQVLRSMGKSMVDTSLIMAILASAMLLGHYLSMVDLGGRIAAGIQSIGLGKTGFLFMIMGVRLPGFLQHDPEGDVGQIATVTGP